MISVIEISPDLAVILIAGLVILAIAFIQRRQEGKDKDGEA